jgi:hypothetical protein
VPQNGETNRKFGIYKSVCCGAEIAINLGATFPDCPNHLKLTTIWKPIVEKKIANQTANQPEPDPTPGPPLESHVENRRLFNLAAGRITLEPWEQVHLHACKVCQGVLNVLLKQPINGVSENPGNPADAA